MPKKKTHKGLMKRVKVTARGKILRSKAGKSHLMSSKSSKRRRRLGRKAVVPTTDTKTVRRMLAMG
jgi:large subunit ribosomal protein L35